MIILLLKIKQMKKEFKLDFIKYYPDIKEEHWLSSLDTLVYWYIKAVIEFKNNVSCFATSNTIAKTLKCNPWSIDNSINKLKKEKLIETTNKFIPEQKRNKRVIYLFWKALKKKFNEVDEFFEEYWDFLEDTKATRWIIWHLLFKLWKSPEEIIGFINEKMKSIDFSWEIFNAEDLREIYLPYNEVVEYTWAWKLREFRPYKTSIEEDITSTINHPF